MGIAKGTTTEVEGDGGEEKGRGGTKIRGATEVETTGGRTIGGITRGATIAATIAIEGETNEGTDRGETIDATIVRATSETIARDAREMHRGETRRAAAALKPSLDTGGVFCDATTRYTSHTGLTWLSTYLSALQRHDAKQWRLDRAPVVGA